MRDCRLVDHGHYGHAQVDPHGVHVGEAQEAEPGEDLGLQPHQGRRRLLGGERVHRLPPSAREGVSADLGQDGWGRKLEEEAGFAPKTPSLWLLEGFLPYLTSSCRPR